MGRKSFFGRTVLVIALAVMFSLIGTAKAVDFTADMTETQGESVKTSKLNVSGGLYSLEVQQGNEKLLVIVDPKKNQTVVVVYADKQFRAIPSDDMMSVMNDPFQGYIYTAGMGEEKSAGTVYKNTGQIA